MNSPGETLAFGRFTVQPQRRQLARDGHPVALPSRAFDVLVVLLHNRDRTVSKEELLNAVWPDGPVEENNLTVNMSALRKALGQTSPDRGSIVTVPGRGYRFVADVSSAAQAQPSSPEDREKGGALRSRALLVLASLALVAVAFAVWLLTKNEALRTKGSAASIRSIAVLPFEELNGSNEEPYLGIGIADVLVSRLSRLPNLSISPTSAVIRYTGNVDPRQTGRQLGVDGVLVGDIQRSNDQMRVTVQLLDARDGSVLWADSFDGTFRNVFRIEDLISTGVAAQLRRTLPGVDGRTNGLTTNTDAFLLYTKGRYFWDLSTAYGLRKSIEYYQQAIQWDPNYAAAYAGIAASYNELAINDQAPAAEAFPKARQTAIVALELNDDLAEAHAALGVVDWAFDWDFKTADREFQRALDLNPSDAVAHYNRAFFLMTMGRYGEAIDNQKEAVALDPMSLSLNEALGYVYFVARRFDDARMQFKRSIALDPQDSLFSDSVLNAVYAASGNTVAAASQCAKVSPSVSASTDTLTAAFVGYGCALGGRRRDAERILTQFEMLARKHYVDPYLQAMIHAGLGNRDRAIQLLDAAFRQRSVSVVFVATDPTLDPLHTDARFKNSSTTSASRSRSDNTIQFKTQPSALGGKLLEG